jgi:hypothetical protein
MAKKKAAKKKAVSSPQPPAIPAAEPSEAKADAGGKKLGGVTGKGFMPGQSGNPGGRAKKFTTLLSDAIREKLGEVTPDGLSTFASSIAGDLVIAACRQAKLGATAGVVSKELLGFIEIAHDATEGRPAQKLIHSGSITTDPVERIKELLAGALDRAASALGPS